MRFFRWLYQVWWDRCVADEAWDRQLNELMDQYHFHPYSATQVTISEALVQIDWWGRVSIWLGPYDNYKFPRRATMRRAQAKYKIDMVTAALRGEQAAPFSRHYVYHA